jgi:hypothetical protein
MKTLVFQDDSGILVELLTDLIDGNQQFTVYQIQYRDANKKMVIGLSDALIAAGFDFGIAEYHLGEMIQFASDNDYTLIAVETGKEDEVVYQGTYYGEAIGIDLL